MPGSSSFHLCHGTPPPGAKLLLFVTREVNITIGTNELNQPKGLSLSAPFIQCVCWWFSPFVLMARGQFSNLPDVAFL
jgi:hypothetical protein